MARHYFLYAGLVLTLAGCAATSSWFSSKENQIQVAAGCQALAVDDKAMNLLAVQFAPRQEVVSAINVVHAAIQEALTKCVADAMAASKPAQ